MLISWEIWWLRSWTGKILLLDQKPSGKAGQLVGSWPRKGKRKKSLIKKKIAY